MNEVSVGSRLKRAREQNSLTQAELAGKLGVSQGTIHNFEAGKSTPDSAMIAKLEAILGSGLLSIGPASGILEDASIVGAWLAKNRQKLGLTQQELAGKAGVSQVTVSHIENGISRDPHPKTIKLLEKALGEPFEHDAERELEEESEIRGVGRFTDFDPHDEKSWPSEPGIYVFLRYQ